MYLFQMYGGFIILTVEWWGRLLSCRAEKKSNSFQASLKNSHVLTSGIFQSEHSPSRLDLQCQETLTSGVSSTHDLEGVGEGNESNLK